MALNEARELIGCTVLYGGAGREPEEVIVIRVLPGLVEVSWPASRQYERVWPEQLTLLPEGEIRAKVDVAAASQARLNEFAAAAIRAAAWDPRQAKAALSALREHNWATGAEFEGAPPEPAGSSREHHATMAVRHVRSLEIARAWEKSRAQIQASCNHTPEEAAALLRRSKASAPALVYLVTHPALRAAKIGVSDAAGSRIAEHRRGGLAAPRGLPGGRRRGLRDRGRRSQVVARPRFAAVPQARSDAPGRMDRDRRHRRHRLGRDSGTRLRAGPAS